ncbi:MAG: SUMF1/EgtB/PvdO family nonheme iron enzyme, partial [Acidobacteria bacterium]|nr:SUMF1/EgtB/PvdO family nonheme iron enzyme [Acidobacteriota bacterium]
ARVVRGENFCQQCGYRLNVKSEETVVGACYHCGTYWRSGWLFCKTCGLDRDRALMPPISAPQSPAATQAKVVKLADELPRIDMIRCAKCGADAKPFSRYCESCGFTLDSATTGKLKTPPATGSLRTQSEKSSSRHQLSENESGSRTRRTNQPTISPLEAQPLTTRGDDSLLGRESSDMIDVSRTKGQRRKTVAFESSSATVNLEAAKDEPTGGFSSTVQEEPTISSESSGVSAPLHDVVILSEESQQPGRRAAYQTLTLMAVVLALSVLILILWLARSRTAIPTATNPQPVSQITPIPAVSPTPQTTTIAPPEGMIYVPKGAFQMGRNGGDKYEAPPFTVVVGPFFIDRTEVTNEEYLRFIKATRHPAPAHWKEGSFKESEAKFPVVNVSWSDANAYAKWADKRLPTEAEWEFTARGYDQRIYPWGKKWRRDLANAGRGRRGRIAAVGSYNTGASPFGALDMCGNVWEWTSGNLFNYADVTKELVPGKVIRGGAYDVPPARATTTYRGIVPPDNGYDKTGFRCVRDLK